jgi:SAM-dependent methyltransferase
MSDAAVFLDCLDRHKDKLPQKGRVLELGGGQGWAACIYKKLYPEAYVIATDISEFAVRSLHKWERIFEVGMDNSYACKSYEIPEKDASLDLIFCFASAHHFLAHKRTLEEIARKLRPGGRAIYFHEPATPKLFYPFVYRRMNKKRPAVPEDVLVIQEMVRLARKAGLSLHVDYYPSLIKRGPLETVYFYILNRLPFLQPVLPSSVNLIFIRRHI